MSFNHFIRTVWSTKIQNDLEERGKLVKDCTRAYEGDCQYAQTVKILGVGDPTIGNYVGQDINIEEMKSRSQDLTIDVQKYFAFQVPDVDKAQSVPGLPEKYQEKAVKGLALKREKFVGALAAGKAQSSADEEAKNDTYKPGAENIIVATNKTKAAIRAALNAGIVKLRENNFDDSGVIEIGPADYSLFKDELVDLKTNNDDLISRGVVGKFDNYEVKSTNNIYRDDNYTYAMVRSKHAIAFVGQIKDISLAFLAQGFHFVDVHDVLPVASDKGTPFETLLYSLQTASEHILFKLSLTVCIPDLYVIVVRFDVEQVFQAQRELERTVVVEKGDLLLRVRLYRLVSHDILIVHQSDDLVLVYDREIHSCYQIGYSQSYGSV